MTQNRENDLQKRFKSIIERDYKDLPLSRVVLVLEELASDFERMARSASNAPKAPPATPSPPPAPQRPASSAGSPQQLSEVSQAQSYPEIAIVAEDDTQVAQLLNQVVNIGAIMLQVDEPLQLNELVTLQIEYGSAQFSMEVTARVVNISPRGTAVEIMKLGREDRAALEKMYLHYQYLLSSNQPASNTPDPSPGAKAPSGATSSEKGRAQGSATPSREPRTAISRTSEGPSIPRLGSTINEPRMSVRRQVSLIEPDEKLITTSNQARETDPGTAPPAREEFYGPQIRWLDLGGDPDRLEELVGDRIMDILLQLSGHHFTGVVELEQKAPRGEEAVRWQLFFDSGFLVDAVRSPRQARVELGHMLLLANRAEKVQLSMAAAYADEQNQSLARSLLELDLLSPDALRHAIAGRLTFLLRLLCNTVDGTIRIYEEGKLPAGFLPAPPLRVHVAIERTIFQLLYEKLRQHAARDREQQSAPELDTYPETLAEERERIDRALGEHEPHIKLVSRLQHGRRRLREVFTESPLTSADTFALIFTLHRMGLLRFDRSLHHTVVRERFRENVTVKYLSVHKASYFEVLNVHWSSYDQVIARAYTELIEQFDPAKVPQGLEPEVHKRVSEIRERVESAYQVLAKREHRHAYRSRIMPEYKLAHAIPLFLKQGELAERRQQWDEARDSLWRVLELEPGHPDATARLAHVQKQLSKKSLGESSSLA